MPFIIPNATDIDGSKFIALDQSEPDSLDFQILGDRSTGVLTSSTGVMGCKVEVATGDYTITISEGWVSIKGEVYQVINTPQKALPAVPSSTTSRFDVVLVRLNTTSNTVSIVTLAGTESSTNPTFPKTSDRLSTLTGSYIEPTTDVVLATVYRNASSAVSNACIVDKRVNVPSSVSFRGSAIPNNSIGGNGDLYYKNPTGAGASGTYIKKDGVWIELLLQSESGAVTPIGSIIMWPSNLTTPNGSGPTFWLECNGQYVSSTTYSVLKDLLTTQYGVYVGSTFKLPNLTNQFIKGSGTAGTTGGEGSVQLVEANLPVHAHTSPQHVHSVGDHVHSIGHTHTQKKTSEDGQHDHNGTKSQDGIVGTGGFVSRVASYIAGTFDTVAGRLKGETGFVIPWSLGADGVADGLHNVSEQGNYGVPVQGMQVHWSSETANSTKHAHEMIFAPYIGDSLKSSGTSGENSLENTGNGDGLGTTFSIIPPNITMRWFIRVL